MHLPRKILRTLTILLALLLVIVLNTLILSTSPSPLTSLLLSHPTSLAYVPPLDRPKRRLKLTPINGFFDVHNASAASFGLYDQHYPFEKRPKATLWERFSDELERLNIEASVPELNVVGYKLLFLARHGEGWHNVAEAYYGKKAWDCYWSKLDGNGTVEWVDAHLTDKGKEQARKVARKWEREVERGIKLPELFLSSPLSRAAETLFLTWEKLLKLTPVPRKKTPPKKPLPKKPAPKKPSSKKPSPKKTSTKKISSKETSTKRIPPKKTSAKAASTRATLTKATSTKATSPKKIRTTKRDNTHQAPLTTPQKEEVRLPRPIFIEHLRETLGVHTCDSRRTRTYLAHHFPLFSFEPSFHESDPLWSAIHRETPLETERRVLGVLEALFLQRKETWISITTHSGAINGILDGLRIGGVNVGTGGVIAVVVKAEMVRVKGRMVDWEIEADEKELSEEEGWEWREEKGCKGFVPPVG